MPTPRPIEPCPAGTAERIIDRTTFAADEHLFGITLKLPDAVAGFCPGDHLLRFEPPRPRHLIAPIDVLIETPQPEMRLGGAVRPKLANLLDLKQSVIALWTGAIGTLLTTDRVPVQRRSPWRVGDDGTKHQVQDSHTSTFSAAMTGIGTACILVVVCSIRVAARERK